MGLLKTFLILALLFSFSGCATTTSPSSSKLKEEKGTYAATGLAPTSKFRFDDLPVPAGFRLVPDKSFVFQSGGTRVALLKYTGHAKIQDLVAFYKQQMLLYNWELLNVVEYGRSILNFERGGQSCIVSIESSGIKKAIIISTAPKAKGSIETQTQKSTKSRSKKE